MAVIISMQSVFDVHVHTQFQSSIQLNVCICIMCIFVYEELIHAFVLKLCIRHSCYIMICIDSLCIVLLSVLDLT